LVSLDLPLTGTGVIIAGARATDDPAELLLLGARLGWPVLADPRSGCRVPGTIAAADAIVRAPLTRAALPATVVLLGAPWLSKALGEYVSDAAAQGARVICVDPWRQWTDPTVVVSEFHHIPPQDWVTAALARADAPVDAGWLQSWQLREAAAQRAIDETLGQELSEPLVARVVARHASADDVTLMVAASMPMRDLEWFAPTLEAPPRVSANRGANGIDGVVSTALGIAASGRRTVALLGDLAFLHDVSGLVNLPEVPCTLVVLDNGGGGIFSFLPQAAALDHRRFELLFGTPPTSDVGDVARGFGLEVHEVTTKRELEAALNAGTTVPRVVRVHVGGRAENVALHDAVNEAVRRALD
jgi:2-succinyl-5-enolpyruvyl-6-hydroxy-3-cyclohexene-1-carboxylate synthase